MQILQAVTYTSCTLVHLKGVMESFLLPELGPPAGSPSWRAPRGCRRLGSGTSRRHAPAHAAGRWWRWCGCVGASSWAGRPCTTPEICLRRSPRSFSTRSALHRTCLRTVQYLFTRTTRVLLTSIFVLIRNVWSSKRGFGLQRETNVSTLTLKWRL